MSSRITTLFRETRTDRRLAGRLAAVLLAVALMVLAAGRAEAQERNPARPGEAPLIDGLDGLLGGFFDGLLDSVHRAAHLSIIARDWDAAQLVAGHLAPTDQVLRERSKRMLLMRRRLADGWIVPFVQLGLGQWRVDPDMPAIPHDVVIAGQVGGGAEVWLTSWASMAVETECTVINPSRWMRSSTVWGSFLALHAKF